MEYVLKTTNNIRRKYRINRTNTHNRASYGAQHIAGQNVDILLLSIYAAFFAP